MIIDSLTHVTPDGRWFDTSHDASEGRLLREMDRAGVDKAVVVALAGYIENEFVARTCARRADRLIAGASLNPAVFPSPQAATQATRGLMADDRFALLKIHPRLNGYDPLDPRCLGLLEGMAELGKPIWLDSIFRGRHVGLRKSPADTLHELALRFPEQRFVVLHGLGPDLLKLVDLLTICPNLTADFSLTFLYYGGSSLDADLGFFLTRRDCRTVLGSDFPEYTPEAYLRKMDTLTNLLELSPNKKARIIGGNLVSLLNLTL